MFEFPLHILLTSLVLGGVILEKGHTSHYCEGAACIDNAYWFLLEDSQGRQGLVFPYTVDTWNRQKPGDNFYCGYELCFAYPKDWRYKCPHPELRP